MKNYLSLILIFCVIFCANSQKYIESSIPITDQNGSPIFYSKFLVDSNNSLWYTKNNKLFKKVGNHKLMYDLNHPKNIQIENCFLKEVDSSEIIGLHLKGVFLFDKQQQKIKWIYLSEEFGLKRHDNFIQDSKGNIWLGVDGDKILCYTTNKELKIHKIKGFQQHTNGKAKFVIEIVRDDGTLIIKKENTYYEYGKGKLVKIFKIKHKENILNHLSENGIMFPKNKSGKFNLEGKEYTYTYLPKQDLQICELPIYKYPFGAITDDLITYYEGKPTFACLKSRVLKLFQFTKDGVIKKMELGFKTSPRNIFFKENIMYAFQIYKMKIIKRNSLLFENFSYFSTQRKNIYDVSCRAIAEVNFGKILMTTYNGWFILDEKENVFKEVVFKNEKTKKSIPNVIYGFYKINEQTILAYGHSSIVYEIDLKTNTYIAIPINSKGNKMNRYDILDIEKLDENILLVATSLGLQCYDWKNRRINTKQQLQKEICGLTKKQVNDIYYDNQKKDLWIGLSENEGLIRKNLETGKIVHFKNGDDQFPLIHNNVLVVYPDDENMWVGTEGGLQKININTLKSQTYTFANSLRNKIAGILSDEEYLYLSTYKGIIRINKLTGKHTIHNNRSEDNSNEFNKKSFLKLNDSILFFGTTKGMLKINAKRIATNEIRSTIVLVEASYFDKKEKRKVIKTSNIKSIKNFKISYAHNYLKLKVAVDRLMDINSSDFQYRILESNSEWIDIGDKREIYIQGLAPGNHSIEIRGVNSKGFTNTLKYSIIVEQIVYKKTWFILVSISILFFFLVLYHKKKQHELKQKLKFQHNQINVLRAQMNPHFIFNALNSIIRKERTKKDLNEYIINLSQLMRDTIDSGRDEHNSVKKVVTYIRNFIDFENKLIPHKIECTFQEPFNFDEEKIEIPSMIIQPIVENSIKHAFPKNKKDPKINILFQKKEKYVLIVVKDNGIGYDDKAAQKNKTSQAIAILKERINIWNSMHKTQLYKMTIQKVSTPENGTEVKLQIPYKERLI